MSVVEEDWEPGEAADGLMIVIRTREPNARWRRLVELKGATEDEVKLIALVPRMVRFILRTVPKATGDLHGMDYTEFDELRDALKHRVAMSDYHEQPTNRT